MPKQTESEISPFHLGIWDPDRGPDSLYPRTAHFGVQPRLARLSQRRVGLSVRPSHPRRFSSLLGACPCVQARGRPGRSPTLLPLQFRHCSLVREGSEIHLRQILRVPAIFGSLTRPVEMFPTLMEREEASCRLPARCQSRRSLMWRRSGVVVVVVVVVVGGGGEDDVETVLLFPSHLCTGNGPTNNRRGGGGGGRGGDR